MSQSLISRSLDLRRLQSEGYEIEVRSDHLLLNAIPYVTSERKIMRGTLVSDLELAGDATARPSNHVVMFAGEMPCDQEGRPLRQIYHSSTRKELATSLVVDHSFSSKPEEGYRDYYQKMVTYAHIISEPALSIDPNLDVRTFSIVEAQNEESVFKYIDTASSRAGIGAISEKLALGSVAIVGLGGTGSYILDLLAKTPVKEIHLFDGDRFGQHNAFRSPGAPALETLKSQPKKTEYFSNIYSRMRNFIYVYDYIDELTVCELREMNFVFIAVDRDPCRRLVIEALCSYGVPFIDVGMGVIEENGALLGQIRVSTSESDEHTYVNPTVQVSEDNIEDVYSRNIQIAELNALNAVLAVIKWKKLMGFYLDLGIEHSSIYQIDGNCLVNEKHA